MAYLIFNDYKKSIQTDNLSQVNGGDYSLVTATEQRARQEIISYLVQKYDTGKEFTDTIAWAYGFGRKAKARVYLDAALYSATSTYALNSLCLFNSNVYINTNAINTPEVFNITKWQLLGPQYEIFYVTPPVNDWDYYAVYQTGDQVLYENKIYTATTSSQAIRPDLNSSIWGSGTDYIVSGTVLPTDATKYTKGDNRNQQILGAMVDIVLYHLHSRISPNNIPALRYDRYKDVMAWLKNCARGDDYTLDIPKLQPKSGNRNQYGSSRPKSRNDV